MSWVRAQGCSSWGPAKSKSTPDRGGVTSAFEALFSLRQDCHSFPRSPKARGPGLLPNRTRVPLCATAASWERTVPRLRNDPALRSCYGQTRAARRTCCNPRGLPGDTARPAAAPLYFCTSPDSLILPRTLDTSPLGSPNPTLECKLFRPGRVGRKTGIHGVPPERERGSTYLALQPPGAQESSLI